LHLIDEKSPENFPGFFVVLQVAYFEGPSGFPPDTGHLSGPSGFSPETGLSNRTDP